MGLERRDERRVPVRERAYEIEHESVESGYLGRWDWLREGGHVERGWMASQEEGGTAAALRHKHIA